MAAEKTQAPGQLSPDKETAAPPPKKQNFQDRLAGTFKSKAAKIPVKSPFATPEITVDIVNDQVERGRAERTMKRLTRRAILVAVLGACLSLGAPFFAPLYQYHSVTPEGRSTLLVPLDMPNLTDPAVVSWAATSVTEILSFGFGDVDIKPVRQKPRFTVGGWNAFVAAFMNGQIAETFKKSQMVMTTVPTDTPVIVSQGVNEDGVYEWKLEVPIITTYATNNNVIKPSPGNIEMTIIRVPADQSPAGIAIDIWKPVRH